jgi:hypothetical protein
MVINKIQKKKNKQVKNKMQRKLNKSKKVKMFKLVNRKKVKVQVHQKIAKRKKTDN